MFPLAHAKERWTEGKRRVTRRVPLSLEALEDRCLLSSGFVDHFEGPALDPFWSTTQTSGSITYPSTAQVHDGQQAVQLNSTETGSNKEIILEHTFSTPTYGRVSVWFYDNGAGVASSNYIGLQLNNTHVSTARDSLFTTDYDLGPGQNGSTYYLNPNTTDTISTGFERSQGWHQFTINVTSEGVTFYVDGASVYNTTDFQPFDQIYLFMQGASGSPAWTSYFDDFEFTPYPESPVNTTTKGSQGWFSQGHAVATDAAGDSVVLWKSNINAGGDGIFYAQRYDPAGNPVGGEIQVTPNDARYATVAMDATGDFVVTWDHNNGDTFLYDIYAQRFNAAGVAQGSAFLVNTHTTDYQMVPDVAMDSAGNFTIVWHSFSHDGSNYGIYGQQFDSSGSPKGGEFQVNTTIAGDQQSPRIGMDGHGDFVVAWTSSVSGSGYQVMAQLFNAAAVKQGGEFQVNTTAAGQHTADAVALDSAGNFVVTWDGNGVGDASGVFARRYTATGVARGSEFRVNTTTTNTQASSAVAMDPVGNFLVTWQSQGQDGDGWGIYGQRYNAAGVKQGGEFPINVTTAGDQTLPSVAMNAAGDAFVVWQGNGLGDDQGIFARQYVLPRVSVSDASVVEGNSGTTNMVFRVSLSAASIWPVMVNYSTVAGTAKSGSDYKAVSGTITFLPGETLKNITVAVLGDTLYENNENFSVKLSAPTNGVLSRSQGSGTIINDDLMPTLSIGDVTAAEPNGVTTTFTFTVTLSAPSGLTTTVNYATANDTALAGIDYVAKSGKLTFNPGVTSQTITITVKDDQLSENNEDFFVLLSSPLNAALGKSKGVGTILEQ